MRPNVVIELGSLIEVVSEPAVTSTPPPPPITDDPFSIQSAKKNWSFIAVATYFNTNNYVIKKAYNNWSVSA